MITIEQARAEVVGIQAAYRSDPEMAHGDEDYLLYQVLRTIASGLVTKAQCRELAHICITLAETPRSRRYA